MWLIILLVICFIINPVFGAVVTGICVVGYFALKIAGEIFTAIDDYRVTQFSSSMSGTDYEKYVAYQLKRAGFVKAEVTKKSGDFGADIILTDKDGSRMCVQCKQYSKPVGVKAVQEVIGAKAYYACSRAAVITTSTFTPAAKELAQRSGVELYEKFYPKTKDDLDWIDRMEEIDSIIED